MLTDVVLATHNVGKLREFQALLKGTPLSLRPYPSTRQIIEETGTTYEENARLKAHFAARKMNRVALADDSGIEVDALAGAPGVHTARFVSDDSWINSREILSRLMEVPLANRTARMRAVLCLAFPNGEEIMAEGVLEGFILGWPRGQGGFGFDPVFSLDGRVALAEWPEVEKNRVSHRARALHQLLTKISRMGG